jgi:choline dehydrogenase-like flavoprotein
VEERLHIGAGNPDDVNANNRKLWDGATKLGFRPELIRRNVKGCARLGYCGMGCPLDAKQSALVTYVPDAIAAGADLRANCRVTGLQAAGRRVTTVIAEVLDETADRPSGGRVTVRPKRGVVLAAGAINTPALLLRARLGNRSGLVGKRTFLHPTVPIVGMFEERIEGFYGAPQSVAVHHFADRGDRIGYFLEVPPVHPMLSAIAFPGFGAAHTRLAQRLAHVQGTIALLIDGHHDDEGGTVAVSEAGRISLHYPWHDKIVEAARDALRNAARLLLAAGATEVITLHDPALVMRKEADIARIDDAPFGPNRHTVFSAHQMGGAAMGEDPARSVVDSRGRHHDFDNLWLADGSVFPTSLGVNPQLAVYACARLFATEIARAG